VLRGVSLSAPPGRTLALVGASGAGKSTLFHLLEAFYPPANGRVRLDGVDARAAPPAWLHAAIGAFCERSAESVCIAASELRERVLVGCSAGVAGACALPLQHRGEHSVQPVRLMHRVWRPAHTAL
jgi:ABC-type multidrug transport system fused ATPase/permease subunit